MSQSRIPIAPISPVASVDTGYVAHFNCRSCGAPIVLRTPAGLSASLRIAFMIHDLGQTCGKCLKKEMRGVS